MLSLFSGNPVVEILQQADTISRLTLLVLLIMSIICWTITLYKGALLHARIKMLTRLIARMNTIKNSEELIAFEHAAVGTAAYPIIERAVQFLRETDRTDFELLDRMIDQGYQAAIQEQEEYMTVLSTSAAASPLIGLFGTVWGLIHAFVRISERQSADITTVAPGIAEALITTLAGLVVAIPALVMYHYLQTRIKALDFQLAKIADDFLVIAKKMVG